MKYHVKYEIKDTKRHLEAETFVKTTELELERVTKGKNVIDKKVFRKATPDSTIVTHQWETDE